MLAGISSSYGYHSPLDCKLVVTGVNQDEDPWWYTQILGWISMVRQIGECPSTAEGTTFKSMLKRIIDGRMDPNQLYVQYKKFKQYVERLGNEQAAK